MEFLNNAVVAAPLYYLLVVLGFAFFVLAKIAPFGTGVMKGFEWRIWMQKNGVQSVFSLVIVLLVAYYQVSSGGILTAMQGFLLGAGGDAIFKALFKIVPFLNQQTKEG